jgi:Xaa-Pro dipeptidase
MLMSNNEELERARDKLKKLGVDWALVSSRENVTYVSHFETPTEFGFYEDAGYVHPLCLFAVNQSASCLVVQSWYEPLIRDRDAVDQVLTHSVYDFGKLISPRDSFLTSLRQALRSAGLDHTKARLAIEEKTLPTVVLRVLLEEFPHLELLEAEPALMAARLVKTPRELGLLRAAAEVNKAGQREFLSQWKTADQHELAVWGACMRAMQMAAMRPLDFFVETIVGSGIASFDGGPKDRIGRAGDMALADISIRVNGYWSDTTNTVLVGSGEPTARQRLYGIAAREAFYAAAEALRPGRPVSQVFEAAQLVLGKHGLSCPHHVGHQTGTMVIESPKIVPYDHTIVQAGMVFAVEPGVYEGEGGTIGARMEKQVIVHESGPEIVPDFEWGF